MIYHDFKSFNNLDKVKTAETSTSIKSSLSESSFNKLLFSETNLIVVK